MTAEKLAAILVARLEAEYELNSGTKECSSIARHINFGKLSGLSRAQDAIKNEIGSLQDAGELGDINELEIAAAKNAITDRAEKRD